MVVPEKLSEDTTNNNDENEIDTKNCEKDDFQLVDTTDIFITNNTFDDKESLVAWVKDLGMKNHIYLIIDGSQSNQKYKQPLVRIVCERSGFPRRTESVSPEERKRNRLSKKIGCRFRITGKETVSVRWVVANIFGWHNHNLGLYSCGYSVVRKLNVLEKKIARDMSKTAVPPRDILSFIKLQNPENRSTSKTIYNFRQLVKEKDLNGHSVPQYLFKLLEDNGYGYSIRTEPGSTILSDVLFVHPDSIKLLHAFPYVLIMDSTYNTNRYKLPLFQIVGFVSTGRTFTAGYGFLSSEKTEVYTWVLDTFQMKFLKEPPCVIVTDRELGLIAAVKNVFPDTFHALCRFHIEKDVESRVKEITKTGKLANSFAFSWRRLVESGTLEEYEQNWAHLKEKYKLPKLIAYLENTWLTTEYKPKIVSYSTDENLHFGTHITNRVESEHSILKRYIGTTSESFDYVWNKIHLLVQTRLNEITSDLERSRTHCPKWSFSRLMNNIKGKVAIKALELLRDEAVWIDDACSEPSMCSCRLRKVYGLPCACEMFEYVDIGIPLNSIHPFWRTLDIEQHIKEETNINVEEEEKYLDEEFENMSRYFKCGSVGVKRRLLSKFNEARSPQKVEFQDPPVRQTKGRSKTNSTRRLPSHWEYTDKLFSSHGRGRSPSITNRWRGQNNSSPLSGHGRSNLSPPRVFPFLGEIPSFIKSYILDWVDVKRDGNCGYRAIAKEVWDDEEKWVLVWRQLWGEIQKRKGLYTDACMLSSPTIEELMSSIAYWDSTTLAPKEKWMSAGEMGLIIATKFNILFVVFSRMQSLTCLPLTLTSALPKKEEIVIGYLEQQEHFIWLKMCKDFPLPPIHSNWRHHCDDSVAGLPSCYSARLQKFREIQAPNSVSRSPINVDDYFVKF